MNGLTGIFGIFLLIFILISVGLTVFFFTSLYMKKATSDELARERNPPRGFAEYIGLKCPDGFSYMGKDPETEGNHLCRNELNVPVRATTCYKDAANKVVSFPDLNWQQLSAKDSKFPSDAKGVAQICNYMKDCGPAAGVSPEWTGVNSQNGWIQCPV